MNSLLIVLDTGMLDCYIPLSEITLIETSFDLYLEYFLKGFEVPRLDITFLVGDIISKNKESSALIEAIELIHSLYYDTLKYTLGGLTYGRKPRYIRCHGSYTAVVLIVYL